MFIEFSKILYLLVIFAVQLQTTFWQITPYHWELLFMIILSPDSMSDHTDFCYNELPVGLC